MAEYQLTATDSIIRTVDGASIPPDPANMDYAAYLKWVEDGGVPDPYVSPELVASQPTSEQLIMFNHENRLRYFEGKPPLSVTEFAKFV